MVLVFKGEATLAVPVKLIADGGLPDGDPLEMKPKIWFASKFGIIVCAMSFVVSWIYCGP